MKVLSKDKAKGNVYGTMKKMKKKNRLLEEKDIARRTENKRVNAENRKEREEKNEFLEKASKVKIIDFLKGMLIIEIDGVLEKRAVLFEKRDVNLSNYKDKVSQFEVKVYGETVKISNLSQYSEKLDEILWKMEELF